jgi:CPA2 family monovalent cation:H+ antiporter-2/trk system potassium uptake protein TrkA
MEVTHSFVPLLLVALLAFVVPLVLQRFNRLAFPVVVGEIPAGIIVGDSGLKLVGHDPILEILAFLGFVYLMFLSGLEVDFGVVLPKSGTWQTPWKERL